MSDSTFWRGLATIFVVGFFCFESNPNSDGFAQIPVGVPAHAAEPIVGNQNGNFLFTSSQDGRKLFMWRRDDPRLPKFVGEVDAILSQ